MGKSILVNLSQDYVNYYSKIAEKYLLKHNVFLSVADTGDSEFGIRITYDDGEQNWFRSESNENSPVLTWDKRETAEKAIQEYAMPNIGYRILKHRIVNFYRLLERYEKSG